MRSTRDNAYKFGCGRYRQGQGILACCGEEAARLGAKNALILGGRTALSVAEEKITASLSESGIAYTVNMHEGQCSPTASAAFAAQALKEKHDLIIGVGGGRIPFKRRTACGN